MPVSTNNPNLTNTNVGVNKDKEQGLDRALTEDEGLVVANKGRGEVLSKKQVSQSREINREAL